MVFGSSDLVHLTLLTWGPLASYLKLTVSDLGFKLHSDLKLDPRIGALVKSIFF